MGSIYVPAAAPGAKIADNIQAYQRGSDPVCVNWDRVLEDIEDDPNCNKYVFNYS